MHLRNGTHGYGVVTKLLHWLTVALFALQFWVGYTMETDRDLARVDCDPAGERRSGGDTTDAEEERLDRIEEACEAREEAREQAAKAADDEPSRLHVGLGVALLLLGTARVGWRRLGSLPPWSERLGPRGRKAGGAVEKVLLGLMFLVPASGLLLLVSDDLVALHVAAHLSFFAALAVHLVVVLGHRLLPRMLPLVSAREASR
ncbi:cytochrome b/b6 domain-containing protein [Nocardioides sp.]|uniref:cytochrome b/b6 domain-containing protein n=1 Tax=Nocardioides sp. TaxID=35761 RepID=UPI002BC27CE3|nr:cytochrome b/b6 domain-containing protein [Nocardioides sp.]HSX66900.1 cytochrome b/b6 domain-containing protein [Nocardioides sp.]